MHACMLTDCSSVTVYKAREQNQLGLGERSFKGVLFSQPGKQIWLVTRHWLSCSQLCSRALKLGWEANDEVTEDNSRPLCNGSFLGIEPATPILQVGEITKSSPRRTHCKLWAYFFGGELDNNNWAYCPNHMSKHTDTWLLHAANLFLGIEVGLGYPIPGGLMYHTYCKCWSIKYHWCHCFCSIFPFLSHTLQFALDSNSNFSQHNKLQIEVLAFHGFVIKILEKKVMIRVV